MDAERAERANKTLIITHDHCALHMTRKNAPERPMRLQYVMAALKQTRDDPMFAGRLEIQEITTSEAMLAALSHSCCELAQHAALPGHVAALSRTMSVGYLEENIVPAVKAVHTQQYLQRLASTCVHLLEEAASSPTNPKKSGKALEKKLAELDSDTVVSASSLSAALCAALSCCYAVDATCDGRLAYANAFAVIRPPGHHAGANGPTVGPHRFASVAQERAVRAQPAIAAFEFANQPPAPCDGMDCSQGFCLLNNAAIAARHALLHHQARIGKVAIVDIDLHHGNGAQQSPQSSPHHRVLDALRHHTASPANPSSPKGRGSPVLMGKGTVPAPRLALGAPASCHATDVGPACCGGCRNGCCGGCCDGCCSLPAGTEEIVRGWTDVMYISLHGVGVRPGWDRSLAQSGRPVHLPNSATTVAPRSERWHALDPAALAPQDHTNGAYFYPDTATTLQQDERLVNVPLPQGTPSAEYLAAFDAYVPPNLRRFAPDLIIISCGFDACAGGMHALRVLPTRDRLRGMPPCHVAPMGHTRLIMWRTRPILFELSYGHRLARTSRRLPPTRPASLCRSDAPAEGTGRRVLRRPSRLALRGRLQAAPAASMRSRSRVRLDRGGL